MSALERPFQIDRLTPPTRFYTPKEGPHGHNVIPGITVLARNGDHEVKGYVTVGYVSRQTPFGQGISMGMETSRLRIATPDEILRALQTDHPHGAQYRPSYTELDQDPPSILSRVWDLAGRRTSGVPLPTRRTNIKILTGAGHYQYVMTMWDQITQRQIAAIHNALR